jgi:uncharacterized protein YijF (DUF1287 family)
MKPIIESKLRAHREQLSFLQGCFQKEMQKHWSARNRQHLVFLWKEQSIHERVVAELEDVLTRADKAPE